jgi:RNA recognition motif-containing protein
MGKKLYVGNLPYSISESSLNSLFSECGTVESVKIISDRETGRSKGFAFVEMADDQGAEKAISTLNGSDQGGRAMNVAEARPEAPRAPRSGGGFGGGNRDRGGFGGGRRSY